MKPISVFVFLAFTFISTYCISQPYDTKSKSAIRHFKEAEKFFNKRNDAKALEELESALKNDEKFTDAWLMKAEIFSEQKKYADEIACYQSVLALPNGRIPLLFYRLGKACFAEAKYAEAKEYLEEFLANRPQRELAPKARKLLVYCEFSISAIENPVPFDPVNLGPNVNSDDNEFMPSITTDESLLVFTREVKFKQGEPHSFLDKYHEDFFQCRADPPGWSAASNLGPPVNTLKSEGSQCLTPDGQYMFFAACNRDEGYGDCDIYMAKKTGKGWSEPVNLGSPVNTSNWESHPSISPDGRTLYFASYRAGGKGGSDIWKSVYNTDRGYWSVPENLGDSINTANEEVSPFIHPDNQTLYFASDGHPGLGSLDIFYTRRIGKNKWKKPLNLGYPINSNSDENFLVINAKGDKGYFASSRPGSRGLDLYSFELYPEARPVQVSYVKGKVFDEDNRNYLKANVEMIDLENGEIVGEAQTDPANGEFLVCLPSGKDYALNIKADNHLFYSENFSLSRDNQTEPIRINVPLSPIIAGKKTIMRNIFFETNSYSLVSASEFELKKLIAFLNDNSELRIEISGHTDNVGQADKNLILSKERAKSVYNYLIEYEIDASRLDYKGYGEEQPVATNETEEGRAQNRRTEFKIL